jgi:glyoxylase-like metal-dependent hydrolase (beta-lactamase superfamily II)
MIESFKTGPIDNNVYVVVDDSAGRCAVVDPGPDSGHILATLQARGLAIAAIVNTHGHWDHVAGNGLFVRASGAPIYRHPLDEEAARRADQIAAVWGFAAEASPPADHALAEGATFELGPHRFALLHVPGHSPGSICLLGDGVLICGDVLFRGSVGRTDIGGGSLPQLLEGIRTKLMPLPDDTRVLPGHGPETTIGHERRTNPFISR